MKAVLFDLFHTLLSADLGGEREGANQRIGALLEVDPAAFDREFSRAARERYTGKLGDLATTIRVIAELPAAAALGMRAIRTTQYANSDPSWTGPVIASLAELPGIL